MPDVLSRVGYETTRLTPNTPYELPAIRFHDYICVMLTSPNEDEKRRITLLKYQELCYN